MSNQFNTVGCLTINCVQIYMILIDNADYCEFLNKAFTIKIDVAKKLSIIKVP